MTSSRSDMGVDEAVDIVAHRVLDQMLEEVNAQWADFPEIGEDDWGRVCERLSDLAGASPDVEAFVEAYALLESRADNA